MVLEEGDDHSMAGHRSALFHNHIHSFHLRLFTCLAKGDFWFILCFVSIRYYKMWHSSWVVNSGNGVSCLWCVGSCQKKFKYIWFLLSTSFLPWNIRKSQNSIVVVILAAIVPIAMRNRMPRPRKRLGGLILGVCSSTKRDVYVCVLYSDDFVLTFGDGSMWRRGHVMMVIWCVM